MDLLKVDLAAICFLCASDCGIDEHGVYLAMMELDCNNNGLTEGEIMDYCNNNFIGMTLEDIHLRMAYDTTMAGEDAEIN